MSAAALLSQLAAQGLHLTRRGGSIVISPRQAATPEVVDLVRANKPDLLALLPDGAEVPPSIRAVDSGPEKPDERADAPDINAALRQERKRLLDQAASMLRERPGDSRAVVSVPQADGRCLVAIALRNEDGTIGTGLVNALIDPFALLQLAERHSTALH